MRDWNSESGVHTFLIYFFLFLKSLQVHPLTTTTTKKHQEKWDVWLWIGIWPCCSSKLNPSDGSYKWFHMKITYCLIWPNVLSFNLNQHSFFHLVFVSNLIHQLRDVSDFQGGLLFLKTVPCPEDHRCLTPAAAHICLSVLTQHQSFIPHFCCTNTSFSNNIFVLHEHV